MAYLWVQDEIISQRLRVRRVRSEENVEDLGTKPLSTTVIAKHCLTLGYVNMDEDNVESGWQVMAMFWDFGSAVSSQQQAAGDHVQKSASGDPQQQKQLQDPQQQWRASGSCWRCQKRLLPHIALDYDTLIKIDFGKCRQGENTHELFRGNIIRVGAERFRCTELTTNLYRAS